MSAHLGVRLRLALVNQLTLDGLVLKFRSRQPDRSELLRRKHDNEIVCTLYLVFKEPRPGTLALPDVPIAPCERDALQGNLPRLRRFRSPCQQEISSFFVDRSAQNTRRRTLAEQEPQAVTSEQAFRAGTSSTDRNDVSD